MTVFETLTLLISLLAIVLSLHTLREQRKLQREANELQRAADELARRQIREMDQAAVERQKAALEVNSVVIARARRYASGTSVQLRPETSMFILTHYRELATLFLAQIENCGSRSSD